MYVFDYYLLIKVFVIRINIVLDAVKFLVKNEF